MRPERSHVLGFQQPPLLAVGYVRSGHFDLEIEARMAQLYGVAKECI